jgi:hypothetical protein
VIAGLSSNGPRRKGGADVTLRPVGYEDPGQEIVPGFGFILPAAEAERFAATVTGWRNR